MLIITLGFTNDKTVAPSVLCKPVKLSPFLRLKQKMFGNYLLPPHSKKPEEYSSGFSEAQTGFEPVNQGVADPRLTTWLLRLIHIYIMHNKIYAYFIILFTKFLLLSE